MHCCSRFWLHPGARPKAVPSRGQGLQGDGRWDGWSAVDALCAIQELLLYGVQYPAEERKPYSKLGHIDGGCEYPRHQAPERARADPRKVSSGPDGGGSDQALREPSE